MSQTFKTTELAGSLTLVTGTDLSGSARQTILHAREFAELKRDAAVRAAAGEFDTAVEDFFAPLVAAAERAEQATKVTVDPAFHIVEQEHEVGSEHKHEVLRELSHDTAVLRLIDQGNFGRLLWVGDTIEVLAQGAAPATEAVDLDALFDGVGSGDEDAQD